MVTKHLTDEEVQVFVFDKGNCELRIAGHIRVCQECNAKVKAYHLLIDGIRQQPQATFDFDIATTVLERLPAQSPRTASDKLLTWIIIFICTGLIGTVFYVFRGFLNSMFRGIAGISAYLLVISAITVIAVVFIEMQKRYNKEIRMLDPYLNK
jgi:hypothetical protein